MTNKAATAAKRGKSKGIGRQKQKSAAQQQKRNNNNNNENNQVQNDADEDQLLFDAIHTAQSERKGVINLNFVML